MEASASNNHFQQATPQKRVFKALSPNDAMDLISKSLAKHKIEITDHDIERLTKRLVRTSEALEASCFIEYSSTTHSDKSINLKTISNQTFMQSLVFESGKLLSKLK